MRSSVSPVHPATFFGLTYLLSWLVWIPLALSHFGVGPFHIPEATSGVVRLLGVLMPATSALILTARAAGRAGVGSLLGRLKLWRVGWQWWAVAALIQPALLVATGLAFNAFGGQPPIEAAPQTSIAALLVNIFFLLIATLGEEIGWRGVALPALQQRYNARVSSLILGGLWAAWHIPFWLLMDTFDQFGFGYLALNLLFVLALTFYITWFFNHSRASLLLVAASHVGFNIVNVALYPVTGNPLAFAVFTALNCIIVLLILPRLEPPASSKA